MEEVSLRDYGPWSVPSAVGILGHPGSLLACGPRRCLIPHHLRGQSKFPLLHVGHSVTWNLSFLWEVLRYHLHARRDNDLT